MKRTLFLLFLLTVAAFGFNWGIYGGPGASFTLTNMKPIHDEISASDVFDGYDVSSFDNYQLGLATPITLRLFNFTIGGGDVYSWQTFSGSDWKTSFHHRLDIAEFGYIVDLSEHVRLTPVIGIGDYSIDMYISELGGGFGAPDNGGDASRSYDYDNFSLTGGLAVCYLWKFESRVVVGLQAKARYLVPMQKNLTWDAKGSYPDATIDDFYPHTPIVTLNFFIGYEDVDEDNWIEEDDWDEWEEG